MTGQLPDWPFRISAAKWQVIGKAVEAQGWESVLKLCLVLLVLQLTADVVLVLAFLPR